MNLKVTHRNLNIKKGDKVKIIKGFPFNGKIGVVSKVENFGELDIYVYVELNFGDRYETHIYNDYKLKIIGEYNDKETEKIINESLTCFYKNQFQMKY